MTWPLPFLALLLVICFSELRAQELLPEDPSKESNKRVRCGGVRIEDSYRVTEIEHEETDYTDKSKWKPFRTHFVAAKGISEEEYKSLQSAFSIADDRLAAAIKTWTLTDLRTPRYYDAEAKRCYAQTLCGQLSVPEEYQMPCVTPENMDKEWVVESSGSSQDESPTVKEARLTGISLVVFVRIPGESDKYDKCENDMSAYSHICFWDKRNLRPTHARISLCITPTKMHRDQLARVLLHQLIHVLTMGTMLGYRQMKFLEPGTWHNRWSDEEMMKRAEGVTWIPLWYDWQEPSGRRSRHHALGAKNPIISQAVQKYFSCKRISTAETARKLGPDQNPTSDESHWSMRLFPDELMSPIRSSLQHLSILTLSVLQETGWYEVDLGRSEQMVFNYSNLHKDGTADRCLVSSASCTEVISKRIADSSKMKWMDPICDQQVLKTSPQRFCSEDGRHRLSCRNLGVYTDDCSVLMAPEDASNFDTDCKHGKWQSSLSYRLGLSISPQSLCLTFSNITSPYLALQSVANYPICIQYECKPDGIRFLLKHTPWILDGYIDECWTQAICKWTSSETSTAEVEWPVFDHEDNTKVARHYCTFAMQGSIVCPDYKTICGGEPQKLALTKPISKKGSNDKVTLATPALSKPMKEKEREREKDMVTSENPGGAGYKSEISFVLLSAMIMVAKI